ncbi:MerR family transcriptional regulator [Bacillus salitolerans]|uniref:MerR family transcriptional regulator n=1 Tax=Bacillus salitolerans TaxID=1437434 RepID=A0ABW4LV17_9BACI
MYVSTGELSKRLNISVRTIRYYNQIGLVQPSKIGGGGKRFYSKEDCLKLEKVLLLKSLSLPLEEIGQIVAEQSTENILTGHKAYLEQQLKSINKAIGYTNSLLNIMKLEGTLDLADIITLIVPLQEKQNWGKYFSIEEQDILQKNLPKVEESNVATRKWINLIKRIELCIEEGISPRSKQAKLIIEDMDILSEETFQGDKELMDKFWEIRRSEESSSTLNLYPINPEIIEFIEKAYE